MVARAKIPYAELAKLNASQAVALVNANNALKMIAEDASRGQVERLPLIQRMAEKMVSDISVAVSRAECQIESQKKVDPESKEDRQERHEQTHEAIRRAAKRMAGEVWTDKS